MSGWRQSRSVGTKSSLILLTVFGVVAASVVWFVGATERPARDLAKYVGDVERGAYFARLAGCIACHTDFKNNGAVLGGGAPIETDFGRFYAPNITPHREDGIGSWTLNDFARSLTEGIDTDGSHLFPSFPYTFYRNLTSQDIVDLWAAVKPVPPVAGGPPPHDLDFPFGFRFTLGFWKTLFSEPEPIRPIPSKSGLWNRGRYLAQGPAHCGACHTPRNILGGRIETDRYEGGVGPGSEKIPAITPGILRDKGWSTDDLAYALRTGIKPNGDVMGGSMNDVIRHGTQFWSDRDLDAISEYLLEAD